ncbi:hypothetical protein [Thalassobium sp. R2A62]|nr:hypothetical protein [Thalassobium sp. R2A62]EET48430.1 hypothetical protein TR2A62_2116 [Thalassobium sp. R2A62]
MFWLARKILIPVAAFAGGMYYQSTLGSDRCAEAGGAQRAGICWTSE